MNKEEISELVKDIRDKHSDVSIIADALLEHIEHGYICLVEKELLKAISEEA